MFIPKLVVGLIREIGGKMLIRAVPADPVPYAL